MDTTDTVPEETCRALTEDDFNALTVGQILNGEPGRRHQATEGENVRWKVTGVLEFPCRLVSLVRLNSDGGDTNVVKLVKWSETRGLLDVTLEVQHPRYTVCMNLSLPPL